MYRAENTLFLTIIQVFLNTVKREPQSYKEEP